jgi:hypothetical protein
MRRAVVGLAAPWREPASSPARYAHPLNEILIVA